MYYYIALGDSISTDDYPGEGRGAASLLFRNQDHLYPEFKGKDLHTLYPGIQFLALAQDGATSLDVLSDQMDRLPETFSKPVLLTLTVGGNDILANETKPEEITDRIRAILKKLQKKHPNGKILIGTIYDPSDGTGELSDLEVPVAPMIRTLAETNAMIRTIGRSPEIRVVDIHSHFLGHASRCRDPQNPHYHPEDPSAWMMMTIEPNARGAHEIRRLFWQAVQE